VREAGENAYGMLALPAMVVVGTKREVHVTSQQVRSLYKSESSYANMMFIPADNILHLHINNLTHDWGKYTLKFDVKSPRSMVRHFQYCSDPSLPVQILVIAIHTAGDTAFIKLEEGDDVKPLTASMHVTAQPLVILSCCSVPGSNDMHPKIHSYRIKPARSTVLDEDEYEDKESILLPNKRRRV